MKVKIKTWDEMVREFGVRRGTMIKCTPTFTISMEQIMPNDRTINLSEWWWHGWQFSEQMVDRAPDVVAEVMHERELQDDKWGVQDHHPFQWLAILGEEVGEANMEVNDDNYKNGINSKFQKYRAELIQVSAVAIAMVESLDRNEGKGIR